MQIKPTWPGPPPEEPPVDEVAMEVDDAMVDPEFDAVHAWTPRDRVLINRMEDCLARRGENVVVDVEE